MSSGMYPFVMDDIFTTLGNEKHKTSSDAGSTEIDVLYSNDNP